MYSFFCCSSSSCSVACDSNLSEFGRRFGYCVYRYRASAAAGKVTQECAKHIEQYSSSKAPPSRGVASVACEFSSDIFKSVSCEYNVGHVFHINRESCRMAQDNILPHPPLTFHADICESIQSRKEINASEFLPSVKRKK